MSTKSDKEDRVQQILWEALKLSGEARSTYLETACAGDVSLEEDVQSLLQAEGQAGTFLCSQTIGPEPTVRLAEKAGDHIGRYKLLEQIGEGGFGVVWMAEQEEPVRRRVALKIIKLGMDTKEVVMRFEAERQALAMMEHPNIARVFDGGATESGRPYFVMELVKGVPVTEYCDANKLSTCERLELFMQVCHAVQHAHQKGIIHRDLKPSNILVTEQDGAPVPKVIDFGVAKATQARLTERTLFTRLHQMIGTPAYMSPEQAGLGALDLDTRSDIYALGVLLYELLTGRTPFTKGEFAKASLDEIFRLIREQDPPKPSTRLSTLTREELTTVATQRQSEPARLHKLIRGELDWIVMKAIEKNRQRRYETANGLAVDIERHLHNEPVAACPPSTAYRLSRLVRRNRLLFTATTVVAVALIAGFGVSTWQTFAARKAQRETEAARKVAETEQHRADAQARKAFESQQHSRRLLYASDMNLVDQALKLNNLGKARRLLDRHRPQPGEEDLRGWEWRYLWKLSRSSALVTLTNRPARGFSVSFSPDGSRLAVGWYDGHVDLWDVPGRRWIRALTDHEYLHQGRVAFSPLRSLLVATSEPKLVTLYDLDSGRESILWRAPGQGAWHVRDLAFSQDGSRVVIYAGTPSPKIAAGANPELGDEVWVVNVSSSLIESRHRTIYSASSFHGAARLSPDNRRLYLARSDFSNSHYSIQCLDLATGEELWQTERGRDRGLTTLDISPDGRVLASGSGYADPSIRLWDAATGRLLARLDGHTGWVCKLAFTKDGRRLVSAASDQSIRFWDTSSWTATRVLRGHTDEVHALDISESAQLVASASKDGDLILWKENGTSATDGNMPEDLGENQVLLLDHSRLLLLPPGKSLELLDLKRYSTPRSLPDSVSSTNFLGWFGTNILCHWNGTNRILIRELRGEEFLQRGAIALESGMRPAGIAYTATRQFLAWSEETSPASVYLANLATPGHRIELRGNVPGLVPFGFSEDGRYLVAWTQGGEFLRVWNVETGQIVASSGGRIRNATFATGGRVLVVINEKGNDHEIGFYDLGHPDRAPQRVPGRYWSWALAVSPDGGLVASSTYGGEVRLFDPAKGELIESIHGHLNGAHGVAFSPDGRRLISASGGREAVKLWDVGTRQELLTLGGTGSGLGAARWSDDGDVILAGAPWQAWSAPSWEEIEKSEAAVAGLRPGSIQPGRFLR